MNEQVKNQTSPGIVDAPMAVYPLNSSAKLDQEPNPFEKSFSGVTNTEEKKLKLPPVASMTSPAPGSVNIGVIGGGILPKEVTNQFTWETLRTGPLSPSMLQGPINNDNPQQQPEYYSTASNVPTSTRYPIKVESQEQTSTRSRQSSTTSLKNTRKRSKSEMEDDFSLDSYEDQDDQSQVKSTKKKSPSKPNNSNNNKDDEKRKNFLERNRIAALKCRQRKKQWLNNLQAKVEFLTNDNERLQIQSEALREEIVNLKTLLLAHKDCPVAQANGCNASSIQKGIPSILSTTTSSDLLQQTAPMGFQPQPQPQQQPQPLQPQQQQQQGVYNRSNSITSTSNPSYQRTNMPSMVAGGAGGGSSGIIRF